MSLRTPRGTITNPSPNEIARYLGHHIVVEVRLNDDVLLEYVAAGRIVVASATGVILRDTTDYTESFLAYVEIVSIRPAVPA